MPIRTAKTTWNGGLEDGTGTVELTSSGVGTYEVSFPKRAADDAGGTTSPEELIAAAHTACYAMQFSALLGAAGGTAPSLQVRADVSLGPDPAGGLRIRGIKLTVGGSAAGVDHQAFAKIAEDAKNSCPVSKALTGTEITLDIAPVGQDL
jgi:osmotically inducible protein OsmC